MVFGIRVNPILPQTNTQSGQRQLPKQRLVKLLSILFLLTVCTAGLVHLAGNSDGRSLHHLGQIIIGSHSPTEIHQPDLQTVLQENKETYALFKPQQPSSSPSISQVPILSDECLESWLARGEPCEAEDVSQPELDVVWTWVNGSDPMWHEEFSKYGAISDLPKGWGPPPLRHYRNKGELQHSFRSVFEQMNKKIRTFHIVLSDWDAEGLSGDLEEGHRIGQIPYWLELIGVQVDGLTIRVHHHSQIFRDRTLDPDDIIGAQAFTRQALPTFNSFSIESHLANIPGLASHWIYLNDDFFLGQSHSISDWVSPAYGPILRLEKQPISPDVEFPPAACVIERSAILRSNWLLSQRFGKRFRVPLGHIPKGVSTVMMDEMSTIYAADLKNSSSRRFREIQGSSDPSGPKTGDLHPVWLATMLQVERARESMLWTWAVARLGSSNELWSEPERAEIHSLLGLSSYRPDKDLVVPVERLPATRVNYLEKKTVEDVLVKMGSPKMESATLTFTSLNGARAMSENELEHCNIRLDTCFGSFWRTEGSSRSAVDMFKRIAFDHPECGDCILSAVISASGEKGLSALLPSPGFVLASSSFLLNEDSQPTMPLTKTFRSTDFSLQAVMQSSSSSSLKLRTETRSSADTEVEPDTETEVDTDVEADIEPEMDEPTEIDVRTWCLRLLARYQYSEGKVSSEFGMIHFTEEMDALAERMEAHPVSSLVLNDDVEGVQWQQDEAVERIARWLESYWPRKGWWERGAEEKRSNTEKKSV